MTGRIAQMDLMVLIKRILQNESTAKNDITE